MNVGLLFGREANALGVAAALNVEDAAVAPAVLVVANEGAVGVGRQRRLAGAGEAEEEGHVAVFALVGRRVQGQDVVLDGHLVEEDGEDALFHLAGVLGAENDHFLLGEVDGDRRGRRHALGVAVGGEGAGIVDGVVGVEVLELLAGRADEHVAHEEGMVGAGADDADADAVLFIPAGVAIDDVDAVARVEVVDGALAVDFPDLGGGGCALVGAWLSRQRQPNSVQQCKAAADAQLQGVGGRAGGGKGEGAAGRGGTKRDEAGRDGTCAAARAMRARRTHEAAAAAHGLWDLGSSRGGGRGASDCCMREGSRRGRDGGSRRGGEEGKRGRGEEGEGRGEERRGSEQDMADGVQCRPVQWAARQCQAAARDSPAQQLDGKQQRAGSRPGQAGKHGKSRPQTARRGQRQASKSRAKAEHKHGATHHVPRASWAC